MVEFIRDLATCFTGCDVIAVTAQSCIIGAPDEFQADGVQSLLSRNGVASTTKPANFKPGYLITVMYGHQ